MTKTIKGVKLLKDFKGIKAGTIGLQNYKNLMFVFDEFIASQELVDNRNDLFEVVYD